MLRFVCLLACLFAAAPILAETQLSPDQLRLAAGESLRRGNASNAAAYAGALVRRDPNDRISLLIQARALRDLGKFGEAKEAAKRAWALSETPQQKYATSMVIAQILASNNQHGMAQLWLRRAAHIAPDEQLSARAIRDFKYVRSRNRWLTRFSGSITPDSNINNGSSERSSFLNYQLSEALFGQPVEYQLGGSALALSGIEYAFGATARYRFHESGTRAHDLIFTLDTRTYTLSDEAKELAPFVSGSDFAFTSYTFGYGHRGLNFDQRGEYRTSFDFGQSWYGGEEYAKFLRFSAGQSYVLQNRARINGRIAAERQFGVTTYDQDTIRGDASWGKYVLGNKYLWLNASLGQATSPRRDAEYTQWGLRAQMTFDQPFLGTDILVGMGYRARDYDVSYHSRDGRQEDRISADLTFVFKKVNYYGFNPTMTVSASRTNSNIDLYQAERFGVNFGIQSAF